MRQKGPLAVRAQDDDSETLLNISQDVPDEAGGYCLVGVGGSDGVANQFDQIAEVDADLHVV